MTEYQRLHGVTGEHTANGRPISYSSITPFIAVSPALEALAFYQEVFGAEVLQVTEAYGPQGTPIVAHAELQFESGKLQLGEPNPQFGFVSPTQTSQQNLQTSSEQHDQPISESDTFSLGLYVSNIEDIVATAIAYGATLREPISTFISGDKFCSIRDPFGVRWSLMCRIEDLSDAKSAERVANYFDQNT